MNQQFQQPFSSSAVPQAQLAQYGLGGAFGQVPSAFPYSQPSPFVPQVPIGVLGQGLGQPVPFGYPYGQPQHFVPLTVNPLEVVNIVARILPLLLQSGSVMPGAHISPFGMQPQLGSIFGQHPYTPLLQSGLFQTPTGGLGSLGTSWGTPFAHY